MPRRVSILAVLPYLLVGLLLFSAYLYAANVNSAHRDTSGTAPTLSSCGGSPSVTGNDMAFEITAGSAATACTATFAAPFAATPVCLVGNQSFSVVNAITYAVSTTAITLTQTGLAGNKVDVHCLGN